MTHMKLCNRQRLGFLAELGWTIRRIAEDMGWSAQTISDEPHNRRVDSDKRYGCSNRLREAEREDGGIGDHRFNCAERCVIIVSRDRAVGRHHLAHVLLAIVRIETGFAITIPYKRAGRHRFSRIPDVRITDTVGYLYIVDYAKAPRQC